MPDDGKISGLYERDFYAWSGEQARAIRAAQAAFSDSGTNDPRASLPALIPESTEDARALVRRSMDRHGEMVAAITFRLLDRSYTQEEILNDWWPDAPP